MHIIIALIVTGAIWLVIGTFGYKVVTGDPTPVTSTYNQLSTQAKNTFGEKSK